MLTSIIRHDDRVRTVPIRSTILFAEKSFVKMSLSKLKVLVTLEGDVSNIRPFNHPMNNPIILK
jgi:hypothetical protein